MDENKFWLEYKTGTDKIYPIEIGFKSISMKEIVYEPETIRGLCKSGCKNYNYAGGCPPRAPLFEDLNNDIQSIFLVYGTFWPEYKTELVKKSSSIYVHFRLQDQILSRLLYSLGLKIRKEHGALFLGTGYCMGCSGKKCNFKIGLEFCRNPDNRTYSMESTGINVCQTLSNVFGINLFWYKKGQSLEIPLTKCGAIFFKDVVTPNIFKDILMESSKSKQYGTKQEIDRTMSNMEGK